jgi:hypothetical protein
MMQKRDLMTLMINLFNTIHIIIYFVIKELYVHVCYTVIMTRSRLRPRHSSNHTHKSKYAIPGTEEAYVQEINLFLKASDLQSLLRLAEQTNDNDTDSVAYFVYEKLSEYTEPYDKERVYKRLKRELMKMKKYVLECSERRRYRMIRKIQQY